ncbi:MAG: hypothetical protein JNL75_00040 [Chitinophagales bacterium]|nr:hypothetical protein [Chitinophagales bacterium]
MNHKIVLFFLFFTIGFTLIAQEGDTTMAVDTAYTVDANDEVGSISYTYPSDIERRKFDSNFKAKYNTDHFIYEPKVQKYSQWDQFKEWFFRWLREFFDLQDKNAASEWFEYLQYFLAFLLVTVVAFFIIKAIINKEGGWIFGRDSKTDTIDQHNVEEKLHLANFSELLTNAKRKNDYRLAIRFYYLWLLRKLSDKKVIQWDINKTNMDYLYEIKNKTLRERYSYHCYVYDYIWYGEFDMSETEFIKAEMSFNETFKSIDGQ